MAKSVSRVRIDIVRVHPTRRLHGTWPRRVAGAAVPEHYRDMDINQASAHAGGRHAM